MNSDVPPIHLEPVDCPLCGSDSARHYISGPDYLCGVAGTFTVVRCRNCRHVYLNPRPTPASVSDCYPNSYGPFAIGLGDDISSTAVEPDADKPVESSADAETDPPAPQRWYLSGPVRKIPGLRRLYYWLIESRSVYFPAPEGQNRRALDVGCSSGSLLLKLRERGWDAQGVEIAESPAMVAKRLGFDVHIGTLESSSFEDGRFDAVFAMMVIEHVPDPIATLREIRRLLVPGGLLVISVPNFGCWERVVFGRYWRGLELPRHFQHFTRRSLRQLAELADFEIEQINDQYNLNNVIASFGLILNHWFPGWTIGQKLIQFTDQPKLAGQLLLAIPSRILAALHQGGRLTVVLRRPEDSAP